MSDDIATIQAAFNEAHNWREEYASPEEAAVLQVHDDAALDRLVARLEAAEARLEAINQPHHVLVLSSDRWTTEHTLACRESGHMTECDVHKRVADWIDEVGRPDLPNGRYIINDGPLPDALAAAAREEESE